MKRITYFLLTLLVLNLLNCYGAFGGTLKEIGGVTTFLHYGGGTTHGSIESVKMFKKQRAFLVCSAIQKGDLRGRYQPTDQNFKYDDYLTTCKSAGIEMIVSFQGKLDYQVVQGKSGKVNPVNDADDPLLESSWADYGQLVKQFAIRYSDDSQPFLSQANVYTSTDYKNNVPKAGLGLVWAMSDRNEYDFKHGWSGAKFTMTPEQSAVGFKVFYESIRSVSKTMRIIAPSSISPDIELMKRFLIKLKSLYVGEGELMPTDWYLDFHWYMRNGSADQTTGSWGITAETAKAYQHGLRMDSLVEQYNVLGWICSETGWATYTGTLDNGTSNSDPSLYKQNAPVMQGYDIYHAQGFATVRLYFIWGSTKYCKGVTVWHVRNGFDTGPYYAGGQNYTNWQPKQGRLIIESYFNQYGNHDIRNFRQKDQLYAVDLYASTDSFITLVWTDQNRFGEYDAKPRIGTLELPNQSPSMTLTSPVSAQVYTAPATVILSVNASDSDGYVQRVEFYQNNVLINSDMSNPYTYTVNNLQAGTYNFSIKAFDNLGLSSTINNISIEVNPTPVTSYNLTTQVVNGKRRIYWSDGQQAILSHADSPEGGLNPSWQTDFANLCRSLPKRGINTITVTLRGDDVTSIFPFTTQGGSTPDRTKMNLWKYQLSIFINECKARNLRPIIIAYIGERTNFNKPLAQYQSWLSVLADVLKSGEDISGYFIFGIEEIGQSWSDNQVSSWWNPLNAYIKSVMPKSLTMLHNNPGKKFWRATSPVLQVDVIDIQETTISNMEVSANDVLNRGYAAHLHEWYGAIRVSQSEATNLSKLNQQLAVSDRIGCKCSAVFASDYDTQRPDTNKLKSIHQAQSNHLYGNIVLPPDTPSIIEIRYSASYTRSPSVVLNSGTTIQQGSYWLFSNTPVNWELKKGTSVIKTTTNSLYLNGNSNTYFQRGFTYTLTTTNASVTKVITFVVN